MGVKMICPPGETNCAMLLLNQQLLPDQCFVRMYPFYSFQLTKGSSFQLPLVQ